MGVYLNNKKPHLMFQEDRSARYFVDKSTLINDLIPILDNPDSAATDIAANNRDIKYICITRPRRFGKTMAANMISSYFGKGSDSRMVFYGLTAASYPWFEKHLNQHNVIHIMLNELPDECTTYAQYISRIKKRLLHDLIREHEIFSAMVVYGFLNYRDGYVSIPNKELMNQFADMLCKEPSLGYVHRLAKASEQMLAATKAMDTGKMAEILEYAHDSESPLLYYNNETELRMIVNMAYLSARDFYQMEREDKAGIGFVDFIFYPRKPDDDCIILELKSDKTAKEAIQQIKDRKYAQNFQGKMGEKPKYTGRILAVGIAYDKKEKTHNCEIEVLSPKPVFL